MLWEITGVLSDKCIHASVIRNMLAKVAVPEKLQQQALSPPQVSMDSKTKILPLLDLHCKVSRAVGDHWRTAGSIHQVLCK